MGQFNSRYFKYKIFITEFLAFSTFYIICDGQAFHAYYVTPTTNLSILQWAKTRDRFHPHYTMSLMERYIAINADVPLTPHLP
jgi:hypothetical protein